MHIIGITGPTGCGKTTLLRVIEAHGGFTVDCDALYYEMLRENAPMRAALTEAFGDIFLPDGSLDRPKLGNRVFSDPDALARLNAIVYHHMGQKMRELLAEQAGQEPTLFRHRRNQSDSNPALPVSAIRRSPSLRRRRCASRASWPATASQKTMPAAALRPKSRTNSTALPAVLCWKTAARRKHSNKPVNNGSKP